MKLYLHIGTEKTGSSYLQTLLARNRKQLINESIYFPKALKLESQMMQGEISPGNGQHLFEALQDHQFDIIKKYLKEYLAEATKHNCETILISNEILVKAFSEAKILNSFLSITEALGFQEVQLLLILRDPVDQALSLYKHRAKNGTIEHVEHWVTSNYHLATDLKQFLINIRGKKKLCKIRKYKKDGLYMNSVMFNDWLSIDTPKERVSKAVNPSLSLSELTFLNELYKKNKFLSRIFYNRMIEIPISKKAKNIEFEESYRSVLSNYLVKYNEVWLHCNKNLAVTEQLILPKKSPNIGIKKINLTFSETQYKEVANILEDSFKLRFYLKLEWLNLRSKLGVLKNKFRQ